jgi:hypothetical protein
MNQFVFAAIMLPTLGLLFLALHVFIVAHRNNAHKRRWLSRAKATRNYNEQVYCRNIAYRGAL